MVKKILNTGILKIEFRFGRNLRIATKGREEEGGGRVKKKKFMLKCGGKRKKQRKKIK